MNPTISVVIPNYNDSEPLKQCLQSILEQQDIPEKIIVVDDQSTDNSLSIIQEHLDEVASAEVIVNSTRLGTMGALNAGLNHVTTDYVLFLSSNDYLQQGLFSHARTQIKQDNFPGVWSAMVSTINENEKSTYAYPSPVISLRDVFMSPEKCIRMASLLGHWFTGTTLLFHTETLKKIGGFDLEYKGLADMLAALTIASLKGASFSPTPYGVMRLHPGGLMSNTSKDLPGLDKIVSRMEIEGSKLSPELFNDKFLNIMKRRIRFTAIREYKNNEWWGHLKNWQGYRYSILNSLVRLIPRYRKLQLSLTFILLRPPLDFLMIIWYRIFGVAYLKARRLFVS